MKLAFQASRRTLIGLLAASCLVALGLQQPARAAGRWAVIVGIDQYQRQDVTPLRYAVADARAIARTLIQRARFRPDHVFLLTSDQRGDGAPTRSNVAFRLGWLADRVHSDDTVVFYFSGHGIQMARDGYLMTVEADPRNEQTLRLSGLSTRELHAMLDGLKARHVLVFGDACRNDPRSGKGGGDNHLRAQMARDLVLTNRPDASGAGDPVSATFLACSPGQRSYEWPDRGHGYFTYYLTRALDGAAADARGEVTVESLEHYLRRQVPKATEVAIGVKQVPWMQAEGAGLSTWPLVTGGPPAKLGADDLPPPSPPQTVGGSSSGSTSADVPAASGATAPQGGSTLTVGRLQVSFQSQAQSGWVGSNGGYVGMTYNFSTGQTGNDFFGGADLALQHSRGQMSLSGTLQEVGSSTAAPPRSRSVVPTPGQTLVVLDHQGYYVLVRVDRVAPSTVFFTYWKQRS